MVLLLLLLLACDAPSGGKDDGDLDGDLDGDGLADAEDPDDDDDGIPDDEDPDPVDAFCEEALPTDAPAGPECVTASIGCGDTIEATTEGGSSWFVGDDYTHAYCFVNVYNRAYEGTERVYALDLPAGVEAVVTADAPCEDVDLAAMFWPETDRCPVYDDGVWNCEGDDSDGRDVVSVSWDDDSRWLIVVEPKMGVDTNFTLSVDCG